MVLPISVSTFSTYDAPRATCCYAATWDTFAAVLRQPLPASLPKKELPLWSLAEFTDGYRSIDNVHTICALTLDVDEAPIPDAADLIHALFGLRAVVYSSSSAMCGAPRWRASIAFSRPVTAEEYPRISAVFSSRLPFPVGSASKDPARQWYMPREGEDGSFDWISIAGEPLDVDALLALAPPVAPTSSSSFSSSSPRTAQHYPGDVEGDEREYRRGLYAKYLQTAPPCVAFAGGDRQLFRVVQHGAHDLALPVADVLELVREHYDPRCSPPWGDELEERVHHKASSAKTSSTRPRAEPLPSDLEHLATAAPESGVRLAAASTVEHPEGIGETWGGWDDVILPPAYLVEGLIPEAKVITLFAEGGSVKTWSAFDIGISVATGRPWLGKYAVKQGRVLILDYEDGRYEFQRRLPILNRGGCLGALPDLGYKYYAPSLDDPELWAKLARMSLRLLIIDTLGSGMPGDADENTTAFAEAVKLAGRFTEGGCTVIIVAHANKSGGLRGSSAIRDSSDVAFKFEPVSETEGVKRMRMVCDKPGPQRKPAPVNIELSDDGLRTFEDAPAATAPGKAGDALGGARLAIETRGSIAGRVELSGILGCTDKAARAVLQALEERGEVIRGRDRRMYWADAASQRRRVIAIVGTDGERIHGMTALAKRAAAARTTIEDLVSEGRIAQSSNSDLGHFFLCG